MLAFELLEKEVDFRIITSLQKSKASVVAAGMINPLVFKRLTKSWMLDTLLPLMKSTYRNLEDMLEEQFLFEVPIVKPLSEQEMLLWHERKQQAAFAPYIGDIVNDSPNSSLFKAAAYATVKQSGYLKLDRFLSSSEAFFKRKNLLIEADFTSENIISGSSLAFKNLFAQKIVFCEGYHLTNNSLFDFVKLQPVKGELLQIHAPHLSEDYILNKKCFVLPVGNHKFKVGATYQWDDLTEKCTKEGRLSIIERLENLVNTEYTVEKQWAGIRPTVIDRRPVLGKHPEHENIYVFNGLGTKGVMLAPYFAKEMMQLLTQRNYNLLPEVDVQRFV
jgi:hypothetical protein